MVLFAEKVTIAQDMLHKIGIFDFDGARERLHPDAVITFPYLDEIEDAVGREAILKQSSSIVPQVVEGVIYTFDKWYEVADQEVIIGEYTSKCRLLDGSGYYENAYVTFVTFEGDKVIHCKEYLNPRPMEAFQKKLRAHLEQSKSS